jgi:hypothetical protein
MWFCRLVCPIILSLLRLNVYLYNTRYRFLLKKDPPLMKDQGKNAPGLVRKKIKSVRFMDDRSFEIRNTVFLLLF